jgi:hypothetical protein
MGFFYLEYMYGRHHTFHFGGGAGFKVIMSAEYAQPYNVSPKFINT